MKISFWIPAVVLYVVRVAFSNTVHVGTVLFTTTDLVKKCWTESDKSLLKARFIMQDVLPDPDCIDFSKPEAAVILLDYFHACYQIISTSTYGKVQNLMYIALSDALGGYLRAYVLPFTRRAYYAGQIQYSEAKKLFQLYDDIKLFLKTSGMGWAEPQKVCYRKFRAKPLVITGGSLEACNQLYTIEKEKLHCINNPTRCFLQDDDLETVQAPKKFKESFRDDSPIPLTRLSNATSHSDPDSQNAPHHTSPPHNHSTECTTHHDPPTNITLKLLRNPNARVNRQCRCENIFHRKVAPLEAKRVVIPLPVLDDCCAPHSIAVPFRRRPLRNLGMRNSAFILEYYYIAVIKCFIAKGNTRTDIKNFNAQFHAWLVSQVFPRLSDERWYPAFGGVLRVMETIRKFGAETTVKDPVLHDIAYMFGQGVQFDITENPKLTGKEKIREAVEMNCDRFPRRHYLTAVLIVSLIWMFIFCTCAFYCQATRGRDLLYEGYSEISSQSRGRKKEKFIDFQFLVKFFKSREDIRREEQVYHCFVGKEKEKSKFWEGLLSKKGKEIMEKGYFGGEGEERKRGRLVMTGEGDVPVLVINNAEKLQHSFLQGWPHEFSPGQTEKTDGGASRQGKQGEGEGEVQTLWRKPSVRLKRKAALKDDENKRKGRFNWSVRGTTTSEDLLSKTSSNSCGVEDETKGSSTEKRSSTCCCSEGCQHSNTTSTKSTSQTQGSTAESESEGDDDDSYTSESDY